MLPISRIKQQPFFWPVNAEPSPWICTIPDTPGVFRIGAVPPPFIVSHPSPLLQGVPAWQVACDPYLPLMSVPSAADPVVHHFQLANGQWVGAHSPGFGYSPTSRIELIPVLPHVYTTTISPHAGKCWVEKKRPNCKIFLNNSFTLESTWMHQPEELILFQGLEKPNRRAYQVTMSASRPAPVSRPLHTVILTPQQLTGNGQSGIIKPISRNQAIAIVGTVAASPTALMGVNSEPSRELSTASVPPCHILAPIKIPFIASHLPGFKETKESSNLKYDNCQNPILSVENQLFCSETLLLLIYLELIFHIKTSTWEKRGFFVKFQ
ncbi:hypothetical protein GDO86_013443 [Hymenochirus boettgeri]|uniref:Uncharacterized protein n=1 Tax=Hymenochirus boettgeri TaxID=247094 RepID=A0A8T2IWT3_9PIPI|nr:hypothetical protein GDO86_013443 [Hymenochirus boettgeri]